MRGYVSGIIQIKSSVFFALLFLIMFSFNSQTGDEEFELNWKIQILSAEIKQ